MVSISIHNEMTTSKNFHDATTPTEDLAGSPANHCICKIFPHTSVSAFTVRWQTSLMYGQSPSALAVPWFGFNSVLLLQSVGRLERF